MRETLKVFDYIDIINAGVNVNSVPQDGVSFMIAGERVYVKQNTAAHTWLSLNGLKGKSVSVEYVIGKDAE